MSERDVQRRADGPPVRPRRRSGRGIQDARPAPLADLQAALGNLELQRRTATPAVQTKLRVSEPGDDHEREADRVTDAVMRAPEPGVVRQEDEEELVATKLEAARQADEEEEFVATKLAAARQADEEEEFVATKLGAARQADEEEELVQPRAGADSTMTPAVESGIHASRGAGHPLDAGTRAFFEPRFGRDLGGVKLHTDSHAARLASSLRAQAFTVGRDVYFAGGRYQPGTESGRRLLAHELTHTIQQQPGAKLEDGAAAGGVAVPGAARISRADRQVQRNGEGGGGGTATIPEEAGVVNEAGNEIRYPKLKLADFKAAGHRGAKYGAQTIKRARNFARGSPAQTTVWDSSIPEKTLEDKIKDKLASTYAPTEPDRAYVLKHEQSGFYLMGTLTQMVQAAKRPVWSPAGEPRPKDVDHIVELQISGWPDAGWANHAGADGNMELLDSQANQDSGRRIMGEVSRLIGVTRQAYRRPPTEPAVEGTDAAFWVTDRPTRPAISAIKSRYDLVFQSIEGGLGQAGQPENHWQWKDIAEDTEHLDPFAPDTEGFESGKWTVFPDPTGGVPMRLAHTNGAEQAAPAPVQGWFSPFRIQRIRLDDPGTLDADAATDPGSIQLGLPQGANRTPYGFDLNQPLPLKRYPGVPNALYLDAAGIDAVWRALSIRFMSPVEIDSWAVVPGRGIMARGRMLPTVPIIADLGIDLVIDGDELRLSKLFDTGDFELPGPVQVTDSSVEVFAGTRGLAARGELGLAIERVGEGRIEARVDTSGGFALAGTFTFDPELFDPPSQIRMGYADGEFSGAGTLTIGPDRVRGIRTATITARYEDGVLDAQGDAELDVPGLQRGTMALRYSEEEGFSFGGTFELSPDVPGIRSGSVEAEVRERPEGEGYAVRAAGTAEPDLPGIDSRVAVAYDDGIFTAEVTAQYRRGMLDGSIRFGATNRAVDEEANPLDEPTDQLRAFGGGSLTLTLAPWLAATAGVRITPEAELEVTGRIGLPSALQLFPARRYDRNIFTINLDIPIVGVTVLRQRIGIFATIGGGLDLTAGFGPGELRDLFLEVTYNPDHEEDTTVTGGAQFYVPADAGLRLFVRGALGAGIPVVSASAGLEIGGQLGIEGAVRAGVQVSWTPAQGLDLEADAEIFAEPKLKFDITGFVMVEADLLLGTIDLYSKRWRLAEFEYGSGLRLGARFPIHYREGQPFDISMDDIEFQVPRIEPMPLLRGLIDRIK